MEENKVIIRKPFDKEANDYCLNKIAEIKASLNALEENKGDFFNDILLSVSIRLQCEQTAIMWGFNSFEDMVYFVEKFGAENLTNFD